MDDNNLREPNRQFRFSRRAFLSGIGAGTLGLAACTPLLAAREQSGEEKMATKVIAPQTPTKIMLRINDQDHTLLVEPRWTLLYVLREIIGLTGTKEGCGRGECGACTVLVDDVPRYACLTLALEARGRSITTVEGLLEGEALGPVQQAFVDADAFQCGYCTPGQIMSVEGLLRKQPRPSVEQIRVGVSGNLCRCGAYPHIVKAAANAAKKR